MSRGTAARLSLLVALATAGCCCPEHPADRLQPVRVQPVRFRDVARERGIRFEPVRRDPAQMNIVEVLAGGAGFLDYDGDGALDLLVLGLSRLALYRNDGKGRFEDVTVRSGLRRESAWMGCAAADYDGDGRVDLVVTGYRSTRLYHNTGGRFEDATAKSGILSDQWDTSAGFADVDNDGKLDLYVGAYLLFGANTPQQCPIGIDPDGHAVYGPCGPEPYRPQVGRLYLNLGNGRFRDVTREAGLDRSSGKTLGAAFGDYNGDGRVDLYLANDRVGCDLFENRTASPGRPQFVNVGLRSGTAYSRNGEVQGGMGTAWGDFDNDGRPDLLVATYQDEPKSLYRNLGGGLFEDAGSASGLAAALPYVGFGAGLFDADNDGWLDVFLTNGHVLGPVERVDRHLSFAQPLQLFQNRAGAFTDISRESGEVFRKPIVGRAAAFGDFDNDGRCDVVVADLEGPPRLLHNETTTENHWLRISLAGSKSNREAIGARVTVDAADRRRTAEVGACGSYLATRDPRLLFGLGAQATGPVRITVRWPGGRTRSYTAPGPDREVTLYEGRQGVCGSR